jgi:hypothetical protein
MLDVKKYKVSDALGTITKDIKKLKWKPEDTLLVYIGDVDYVRNGISSYGKILNAGWLKSHKSIFVKDFLTIDNTYLKGISIIVITRTQLDLFYEKKREDFLTNLFSLAGMDVLYVGSNYNNLEAKITDNDSFLAHLMKKVYKRELQPLKVPELPDTKRCQIIGEDDIPIPTCGS